MGREKNQWMFSLPQPLPCFCYDRRQQNPNYDWDLTSQVQQLFHFWSFLFLSKCQHCCEFPLRVKLRTLSPFWLEFFLTGTLMVNHDPHKEQCHLQSPEQKKWGQPLWPMLLDLPPELPTVAGLLPEATPCAQHLSETEEQLCSHETTAPSDHLAVVQPELTSTTTFASHSRQIT